MEIEELSAYQLMVQKNIEENRRILRSLGLGIGTPDVPKRKVSRPNYARKSTAKPKNLQSVATNNLQPTRICTRRSSSVLQSNSFCTSTDFPETNDDEENTPPQNKLKIKTDPIFGEIVGVKVGDWWPSRLECSAAGVHRPTVAGIHGKQGEGCYSIALSGGYEDDLDCGEYFTYTGCGGRDLKGTKFKPKNLRTAPQSKDQVLEGQNAALATNIENKKPVRVIRGFKLQSLYAPEEGYRYDGLYSVEKYWTATGLSGFKVYKFALKRLGDQEPAPWESCTEEREPPVLQELPTSEGNEPQVDKMQASKAVSPKSECTTFNGCSNGPSLNTSASRSRKQSFPKQIFVDDYDSSDTKDFVLTSSSEFQQELLENGCVVKEGVTLTESVVPNVKRCPENNTDSTPAKCNTDGSVQGLNENIVSQSNGVEVPLYLTTISVTPKKNKNSSDFKVLTQSVFSLQNSPDKTMAISPVVALSCENYDGVRSVERVNGENKSTDSEINCDSDRKKQALILKYFSPIKKPVENLSPKRTVNPKSLRSNRFSNFPDANLDTVTTYVHLNKNNAINKGCTAISVESDKVSPKKGVKSSSDKRKYSSSVKKHKKYLELPEVNRGPSMMENLIKQKNDKLKQHRQIRSTKRKINDLLPLVKPCSVVLKRIRKDDFATTEFTGWDFDCDDITGFEEIEVSEAHKYEDKYVEFLKSFNKSDQDSLEEQELESEGFRGWDLNKDAKLNGTSELVPIAFIIDKLSKSCVQHFVD